MPLTLALLALLAAPMFVPLKATSSSWNIFSSTITAPAIVSHSAGPCLAFDEIGAAKPDGGIRRHFILAVANGSRQTVVARIRPWMPWAWGS